MTQAYKVIDADGDEIAFAVIKGGHGQFYVGRGYSGPLTLQPCDDDDDDTREALSTKHPRRRR